MYLRFEMKVFDMASQISCRAQQFAAVLALVCLRFEVYFFDVVAQVTGRAQDFAAVVALVTSSHAEVDGVDVCSQTGCTAHDFAAELALMYARFDGNVFNVLSTGLSRR